LCDILRNKEPRTGPRHIWHTHKLYAFFGREKNTHGSRGLLKILLASVYDIPRNKEPRTSPRHIWHTHKLYAFLAARRTHGSRGFLKISLASVCYDIPRNKELRTGPRHIWHTHKLYAFFGHEKNTHGSRGLLKISLASVCYGDSRVAKHLLRPHLVFQPIWWWGDLGSFKLRCLLRLAAAVVVVQPLLPPQNTLQNR